MPKGYELARKDVAKHHMGIFLYDSKTVGTKRETFIYLRNEIYTE